MRRRKEDPPVAVSTPDDTPTVATTRRVELTFPHGQMAYFSGHMIPRTHYLSSAQARTLAAQLVVGADAIDKAMP